MVEGIYLIKNAANGKVYVGQSTNLKTRWKSHLHLLRKGAHGNRHLQSAFNFYGEACFKYTIIEYTANRDEREVFWINSFGGVDSRSNYNMSAGGAGGGLRSQEVCAAISARQKGRKLTPQHSKNIGEGNRGKKVSDSQKKYMSEMYKGRPLTTETKRKISETKSGVRLSEEARSKLKGRGSKAISQYSLTGDLIAHHVSAKQAAIDLNLWPSDITQCCLGKRKTVSSFIFKYKI